MVVNYRQTPYLLVALVGLGLATWASVATLWPHSYAGFEVTAGGVVYDVEAGGPAAAAGIKVGDEIRSVDGRPFHALLSLSGDRVRGDELPLTLRTDGVVRTATIVLGEAPIRQRILDFERIFVGLIFWVIGTVVWMLRPADAAVVMFFLMTQIVAASAFGEVLDPNVPVMSKMTDVLRLLLAPVMLHAFVLFPRPLPLKHRNVLLGAAYAGAVLCTIVLVLSMVSDFYVEIWRVYEIAVMGLALAVLLRPLQDAPQSARRRRRILITGVVAGSSPALLLTLSPYALFGVPLLGWEWTLPAIAFVPIAYGYAVYKGELGQIDLILNRSVVYLVLTTCLLGLYALLYLILQAGIMARVAGHAVAGVTLVVIGSILFVPLRTRLQRAVDRAFYGGWYDYRTFVQSVSIELGRTVNMKDFVERLRTAGERMRFSSGVLLWPRGGVLMPRAAYGYGKPQLIKLKLSENGALTQRLLGQVGPVTSGELCGTIEQHPLTESERAALAEPEFRYWLPLICRDKLRSVLVLGHRQGDEALDRDDNAILATLATQAAVACENIQLLESLQDRLAEVERVRDELAETQSRLSEGREEERLHLSRELHDGPVQDLYALLHAFEGLISATNGEPESDKLSPFRESLERVAGFLRDICSELRPPFLNELGLDVTINAHLSRVRAMHPAVDVISQLLPYSERLSERAELAIFRICQEAVNNAVHHSGGNELRVRFEADAERVLMEVTDNGRGFHVPERWIELGRKGHLGLLGIAERAESIGAKLTVTSTIGQGTAVRVSYSRPVGE